MQTRLNKKSNGVNSDILINSKQIEDLMSDLADKATTPLSFQAVGDATTDDTAKLNNTIASALSNNQSIESNKTYYITSPIVIDLQGKKNINIKLRIKPIANIGTAITIKNGQNCNIDIGIFNGGSSTDEGLEIQGLIACRIYVRGYQFLGTLFNVRGYDSNGSKNVACHVDIKAEECGRGIIHGDGTNMTSAFGKYSSVFERNCTEGSIFQKSADITISHYENYFNQVGKKSLIVSNCMSMHIDNLALGGKADYLVEFNDSQVSVNKMLFVNEDTAGQNTKGLRVTSTYLNDPTLNSTLVIGAVEGWNMNSIVDINDKTKISIETIKPKGTTSYVLRKTTDGTTYTSLLLPTDKISGYIPSKQVYLDNTSKIYYVDGSSTVRDVMTELETLRNNIGAFKIDKGSTYIASAGTGASYAQAITFGKTFASAPEVVPRCNTNGIVISVSSITTTGCNLVITKASGANFASESYTLGYIAVG